MKFISVVLLIAAMSCGGRSDRIADYKDSLESYKRQFRENINNAICVNVKNNCVCEFKSVGQSSYGYSTYTIAVVPYDFCR